MRVQKYTNAAPAFPTAGRASSNSNGPAVSVSHAAAGPSSASSTNAQASETSGRASSASSTAWWSDASISTTHLTLLKAHAQANAGYRSNANKVYSPYKEGDLILCNCKVCNSEHSKFRCPAMTKLVPPIGNGNPQKRVIREFGVDGARSLLFPSLSPNTTTLGSRPFISTGTNSTVSSPLSHPAGSPPSVPPPPRAPMSPYVASDEVFICKACNKEHPKYCCPVTERFGIPMGEYQKFALLMFGAGAHRDKIHLELHGRMPTPNASNNSSNPPVHSTNNTGNNTSNESVHRTNNTGNNFSNESVHRTHNTGNNSSNESSNSGNLSATSTSSTAFTKRPFPDNDTASSENDTDDTSSDDETPLSHLKKKKPQENKKKKKKKKNSAKTSKKKKTPTTPNEKKKKQPSKKVTVGSPGGDPPGNTQQSNIAVYVNTPNKGFFDFPDDSFVYVQSVGTQRTGLIPSSFSTLSKSADGAPVTHRWWEDDRDYSKDKNNNLPIVFINMSWEGKKGKRRKNGTGFVLPPSTTKSSHLDLAYFQMDPTGKLHNIDDLLEHDVPGIATMRWRKVKVLEKMVQVVKTCIVFINLRPDQQSIIERQIYACRGGKDQFNRCEKGLVNFFIAYMVSSVFLPPKRHRKNENNRLDNFASNENKEGPGWKYCIVPVTDCITKRLRLYNNKRPESGVLLRKRNLNASFVEIKTKSRESKIYSNEWLADNWKTIRDNARNGGGVEFDSDENESDSDETGNNVDETNTDNDNPPPLGISVFLGINYKYALMFAKLLKGFKYSENKQKQQMNLLQHHVTDEQTSVIQTW